MGVLKKATLKLVGLDGNAFSLMAAFREQAMRESWTKQEIAEVIKECMSGDYDNLLCTLSSRCKDPD